MNLSFKSILKIFCLIVVLASGTRSMADTLYTRSPNQYGNISTYGGNGYPSSGLYFKDNTDTWYINGLDVYLGEFAGLATGPIYGVIYEQITSNTSISIATSTNTYANAHDLPDYASPDLVSFTFDNVELLHGHTYYVGVSNNTNFVYIASNSTVTSTSTIGRGYTHLDSTGSPYFGGADSGTNVAGTLYGNLVPFDDTHTRIISMQPENNSYATSTGSTTPVVYEMTYFIAESDIGNYFSVQVFMKNYDQNTLFGGLSEAQVEISDFIATSSGLFSINGYLNLPNGNYRMKGQLKKSFAGFTLPRVGVIDEVNNQFIVGSSTYIGALIQGSRNSINDIFNNASTTMSYRDKLNTCNPFSGSVSTLYFNTGFDVALCFGALFTPDTNLIEDSLTNIKDHALAGFPLGYVTDFIAIVSTTSTSTLTVLDATVPSVLPAGGSHISLNLAHVFDTMLNATTSIYNNVSASSTRTFYQITSDYWKIFVYLGALFYILARVLGRHLSPHKEDNKIKT